MLKSQRNLCCRVQAHELYEPSHELDWIGFESDNTAGERAGSPLEPHHRLQPSPLFRLVAVGPLANERHSIQYRPISENGNHHDY
jgi:hypothetical protein